MRCGAFGSWHWAQRPVVTGVSASCVRRLAVRVLECLRFGLGIVRYSALYGLLSRPVYDRRYESRPGGASALSAASLGSSQPGEHPQLPVFRFVPHCGQSPRHASMHSGFMGSVR